MLKWLLKLLRPKPKELPPGHYDTIMTDCIYDPITGACEVKMRVVGEVPKGYNPNIEGKTRVGKESGRES